MSGAYHQIRHRIDYADAEIAARAQAEMSGMSPQQIRAWIEGWDAAARYFRWVADLPDTEALGPALDARPLAAPDPHPTRTTSTGAVLRRVV